MELDSNIPLVGRDREVQILMDLRRRIIERNGAGAFGSSGDSAGTVTILVHGDSGCGKTALCQHVLLQQDMPTNHQHAGKKVYSIAGKFDQYKTDFSSPFSALIQAFDSLGQQILQEVTATAVVQALDKNSSNDHQELIATLRQCLSREACLLVQLIPSFQELMRICITNADSATATTVSSSSHHNGMKNQDNNIHNNLYGRTVSKSSLIDSDSDDESDEEHDFSSTFAPISLTTKLQIPSSSPASPPKQYQHPYQLTNDSISNINVNISNGNKSLLLSSPTMPRGSLRPSSSQPPLAPPLPITRIKSLQISPPPPPPLPITRLQTQQSYMTLASERLAVAFRIFLAEFCSPKRPLLLLLDDLQWADVSSINLLAMLAKNASGITNMMMVCCFRDNNNSSNHDLQEGSQHRNQQQQLQQKQKSQVNTYHDISQLFINKLNNKNNNNTAGNSNDNITELRVDDLTLQGVKEMLAKMLHHDLDDYDDENDNSKKLLELATIVHRKTHGNPYFVQQFMKLLVREEILTYNYATLAWQWDATTVQETDVSDNVVSVVLKRMESLPNSVRRMLTLAAFVGYYTSTDLLVTLTRLPSLVVEHAAATDAGTAATTTTTSTMTCSPIKNDEADNDNRITGETKGCDDDDMFLAAEKEGFVEIISGGTIMVFSHDRVQQVAYALATNRDQLHWNIGQVVYERFVKGDVARRQYGDRFVFVAADQLNRGSSCISTDEQRLEVMRLNLYASQLAWNKSSVDLRADFLQKAIALSKETDWNGDDNTYQMVLEIYSKSIEAESSRGMLTCRLLASTVLQHARKQEDARGARAAVSLAYGWSMKWHQAIQEAREVIALCGETLAPSNPRDVEKEYQKVKRFVKGMSDDDLLNLPPMTDELKISAMKMLKLGVLFGFAVDAHYADLCLLKMMELTIRYGHLSETGGFALSGYGCVLVNLGKNEKDEAHRFSQLSLKVAGDRVSIPGTALNVYSFLSHIQNPTGGSIEPTLAAYRTGLEIGDMTFGGVCLSLYSMLYVMNGLSLKSYIEDMKQISGELKLAQQNFCNLYLVQGLQMALSLSSSTHQSFPMTWEAISNDGYFPDGLDIAALTEGQPSDALLCYFGAFESYVLNDWDGVYKAMKNIYSMPTHQFPGNHFINFFFDLIEGLTGVVLFQAYKKRKYKAQAKQALTRLQLAAKGGSSDACLFQQLLAAAMTIIAWPRVPTGAVKSKFDASIAQVSKSGFLHLAAIGNERLGEYMASQKDDYWSQHYLQTACSLYNEWGAHRKVEQMQRSFHFIEGSSTASASVRRGRMRSRSMGGSSLTRHGSFRGLEKEIAAGVVDEWNAGSDLDVRSNSSVSNLDHWQ